MHDSRGLNYGVCGEAIAVFHDVEVLQSFHSRDFKTKGFEDGSKLANLSGVGGRDANGLIKQASFSYTLTVMRG